MKFYLKKQNGKKKISKGEIDSYKIIIEKK